MKTLASTKHRPVIDLVALRVAHRRTLQGPRLAIFAPGAVRRLVLVGVAQLLAQYLADVAREAHLALSRLDPHPRRRVLVERDRHVLHGFDITRSPCNYAPGGQSPNLV